MPPSQKIDYALPLKRRQLRPFVLLVTLFIAVTVLGILNSGQLARSHPAKREAAQADLGHLQTALESFHTDTARYPTTAEGLDALTTNPGLPAWKGPYLNKILNDPWGNPYRYLSPATPSDPLRTYTLSSNGQDRRPNTPDDIQSQ